jgi:hypothetical protein
MDTQPEIYTPIGMHYHVCESCGEVFTAETTDDPYEDGDDTIPVWCGCDGNPGGAKTRCAKIALSFLATIITRTKTTRFTSPIQEAKVHCARRRQTIRETCRAQIVAQRVC